jgi:hypothetical protein
VKLVGHSPWQEFVEARDGMLGDMREDVAQ